MATFWERATGFGEVEPEEVLDLETLQNAITLWQTDRITGTDAKAWMGLTEDQSAELDLFMFAKAPGTFFERVVWAVEIRVILAGARAGRSALDSISNVQAALAYTPA